MAKTKKPITQEVVENVEVVATPVVEVKEKLEGIGSIVKSIIIANPEMKNDEILKTIKELRPNSATSYACIAWYRSALRKAGLIAPRAKKVVEETVAAE